MFQTHDTYTLKVIARDLNGSPEGNAATGTVTIKINDVNDNVPTLEKEQVALFGIRPTKYSCCCTTHYKSIKQAMRMGVIWTVIK